MIATRPEWLQALPDAEQMRAVDRWAIDELGIPSLELMERAAAALAAVVQRLAPDGLIVIVCGGGNNGGDGYAAARILRGAWREVRVLAVTDPAALKGDAAVQLERLPGAPPEPFSAERLDGAAVVVDALLGTGARGAPRGEIGAAIAALAVCERLVVSADVPSGVDASTGEIAGVAVTARTTVAFHASKPGLQIAPGALHAGAVEVCDIGIPHRGAGAPQTQVALLGDRPLLAALPTRARSSSKFTSGSVLVAGGSRGLTGAVVLAASAALRAGAGYVTACVPASEQPVLAAQLVEVMQLALHAQDGHLSPEAIDEVLAAGERHGGALVLGPGLGRTASAHEFARGLARRSSAPLLLDADGLGAFAGRLETLAGRGAATVLTPHAGELGRLLGISSEEVQAQRLRRVREAAARAGAIVVLKGDDTLVAEPGGFVAVSPGASPALATAGTGDVLSGVIGALLAAGAEPLLAACGGVRLHARAGLCAAAARGIDGVIARDVIDALPAARSGG